MRISSKGRLAIGILGLLAVAAVVVWWALQQGQLPMAPPEVVVTHSSQEHTNTPGSDAATKAAQLAAAQAAAQQARDDAAAEEDAKPPQRTWEDHLDEILLGDDNENAKADKILALMPYAPVTAQEELSQHYVNMVQDDHYEGASNLLLNVNTSTNVQEVLINDLLNRNNTLKLTTLLKVLETPSHPMNQNAHDMLELFVQEDYGTNYQSWEKAVTDWLKENETPADAQAQVAPAPDAPAPQ
jgi:hypothetical protein